MASWSIHRRDAQCTACERAFVEGEALFSMLRLHEEELQRGDLCGACFDQRDQEQDLVWWRTSHREKKGGMKLDFELVLTLFDKLSSRKEQGVLDLRFLLALLLVRRRKLRLTGVRVRGKHEFLQLRKPRTRKDYEAEVRELEEQRRVQLTNMLSELMDPTAEGGGLQDWMDVLAQPVPAPEADATENG